MMPSSDELKELQQALRRMLAILVRERWEYLGPWERAIADLDEILASPLPPQELVEWTSRVSSGFGGPRSTMMGGFISDDFEPARDDVMDRLGRIDDAICTTPGYPTRLRRFLTDLESRLLDAACSEEAAGLRSLLRQDEFQLADASALLVTFAARRSEFPTLVQAQLDSTLTELAAALAWAKAYGS
jgi:hypothetical protein